MPDIDAATLAKVAVACRTGLEGLASSQGSMFSGFPRAACGPASEVLGRLLMEEYGLCGFYVCGTNHRSLRREQSHSWVEVDGCLVDITHDQFPATNLSGWVLPLDSKWHSDFRSVTRRPGFCTPEGWPIYPHDGYAAALKALRG